MRAPQAAAVFRGSSSSVKMCGTSPTHAIESLALRDCSPSGAATRQLACQLLPFFQPAAAHLLLPSCGVLHTCTLWPSRPPTARQRRVRPPLCKHWPQADTATQRKQIIIAPSAGIRHAPGAQGAWGRSCKQYAGCSMSRLPTPLLHKTTKSARPAWQADKDAHLCRRQLQPAAGLGSGKKSAENFVVVCRQRSVCGLKFWGTAGFSWAMCQALHQATSADSAPRKDIKKSLRLVPTLLAEQGIMQSQLSADE